MKTISKSLTKLASVAAFFFTAVLFVSANSASSFMIYQEKAPKGLQTFKRIN